MKGDPHDRAGIVDGRPYTVRTHEWTPGKLPVSAIRRTPHHGQVSKPIGTTRPLILHALATGPRSCEQLVDAAGCRKEACESMLRKLMEEHVIVYGGYTITSSLRRARVYRLAVI